MDSMRTILLVDDNPADVDLIREALASAGLAHDLRVVTDGVEALRFLSRDGSYANVPRPELILLDLNLSRKDGREVLKEIKTSAELRTIPVVVLTTSDMQGDILASYVLGANCYVTKPFGLNAFEKVVRAIGEFWLSTVQLPAKSTIYDRSHERMEPDGSRPSKLMTEDIHVLLVEDSLADADFVGELLRDQTHPKFVIECVDRLGLALERLKRGAPDVIVLDLGLPDSQGIDTFRTIQREAPQVPIVILSGMEDSTLALNAVREGAQDYLVKSSWNPDLLSRVIRYAIERKWSDCERLRLLNLERIARTEAERAVLARDEFLSIASHELRTPLTTLTLQMHLLSTLVQSDTTGPAFAETAGKLIEGASKQSGRLVKLIENLLDVSTIGAGKLALHIEEFDLCALAREVVERLHSQLEQVRCPVTLDLCASAIGRWDRFRIEQIVTNLLTNAMKYGAGKPVTVSVTLQPKKAILMVTDRGVGIPKESQTKIFDRFERLAGPQAGPGGLGLGLYIVRQIVEAHHGSIRVASEPGQGAEFTVELPLDLALEHPAAA